MMKWVNFLNELNECKIEQGYYLALFTDNVRLNVYNKNAKELFISEEEFDNKLLDIRIFDENEELRVFRSDIGRKYNIRLLSEGEFFVDYQILETNNLNKKRMMVANYLDYDKYGQAYIRDWRIAGFEEEDNNYGI